jgi:hypothetical protein
VPYGDRTGIDEVELAEQGLRSYPEDILERLLAQGTPV